MQDGNTKVVHRRHRIGAGVSTFFALMLAGCTVLEGSRGVWSFKSAAMLAFFGTKTALFVLLACQMFRERFDWMRATFLVNACGYMIVGGLIALSVLRDEISLFWMLARGLAIWLGIVQVAVARKARAITVAKPA
jgi:hypothetical protein